MLTSSESIEIRSSTPEALEVEATYGPGGSRPPKHFHPVQEEHFEVLAGSLTVRVGGAERILGVGDQVDIARGQAHQMWNPGAEPARVHWRTSPGLRTEQWFRAIDALHREGKVGRNGMPGTLAFGVMLTEYRDVFRLAGPDWLLRPALAALGGLAGLAATRRPPEPVTGTTSTQPHGLCDSCVHQQLVPNTRGSVFSLCQRSRTEPGYPRYPRVPVLSCPGHEPRASS